MPHRNESGWVSKFENLRAFWVHDGKPQRPHAVLTTEGRHSNGYFDSERVQEEPYVFGQACFDLALLLKGRGLLKERDFCDENVNWVVGPAKGAIILSYELAKETGFNCAYTEKDGTRMVFNRRRAPRLGEPVLVCDDVLTTGGSIGLTADAVREAGGVLLSFVAVLVNRSGLTEVGGMKIVALVNQHMPMWPPEECPLCKQGSEALRPKQGENWARLNAVY